MSAYMVMRITIHDTEKLKAYQQLAPGIIEKFHGKILARGGEVTTFEGLVEHRRIVMIEFPDIETANEFYHSDEYSTAKALREGAAEFEIISVAGI